MRTLCLSLLALTVFRAAAVTYTWTGAASNQWSAAGNWSGILAVPLTDDEAVFPAAGGNKNMDNNFGASVPIHRMTFSGSGYTASGDGVTLSSTLGVPLLRATHTSGTTVINMPVTLAEASAFSSAGGGTLTLTAGAGVNNAGNTLTVNADGVIAFLGGMIGAGGVTLTGAGQVVYGAPQAYSGPTALNSGRLSIASGAVVSVSVITVAAGATLDGIGTVAAVTSAGTIAPATSTGLGRLTAAGSVTFSNAATSILALGLGAATTAGTTYDQLTCQSSVTIGAASVLSLTPEPAFAPALGQSYTLLDKSGAAAISGTFSGLPNSGFRDLGTKRLQFNYAGGTGNDLVATVVNTMPSFTKGANQTAVEDSGPVTVAAWATDISDNDASAVQALTFGVTSTNSDLFAVPPAVSAAGTLTFTPAANASGSATVSVTLTDDAAVAGADMTTAAQTFTITVNAVNDPPSATGLSASESYTEDAAINLTDITVNDPDSTAVTVTLTLSSAAAGSLNTGNSGAVTSTYNPGTGVWSAAGAVADVNVLLAGLTFTPAADFNAAFSIATSVSDGIAAAVTGTKAMTGIPVNDPPLATGLSASESYTEDTAINLTDITAADIDSAVTATLTLSIPAAGSLNTGTSGGVTSTFNPGTGVWSAAGAVADVNVLLAGLTFTPAADFNAAFTIATSVSDGIAAPLTGTKPLTGTPVNDLPSFTKGADVLIDEDAGGQTIAGWAAGISDGDPEAAQALSFSVTNNNGALFSVPPAVSPAGELTFTPAANANGSAAVSVSLTDDAAAGGAALTTAAQTFTITVTPVNDPPVAAPAAFTLLRDTSQTIVLTGTDVEGSALTFTIVTPPAHGSFGATTPPGLTYTPDAGYTGPDSFTFKASDGDADSAPATVTLEMLAAATHVWDGGGANDNWSTPANWAGDILPPPGAALEFPAAAPRRTMVNDLATTFTGLRFPANGYSLSGNPVHVRSFIECTAAVLNSPVSISCPVHLEGDVIATRTAASSLSIGAVVTNGFDFEIRNSSALSALQLNGPVSGSGALIFDGAPGSLCFLAAGSGAGGNTFTGGMRLKSGFVELPGASAHPSTIPGPLFIGSETGQFPMLRNPGLGAAGADVTIGEGGRIIVQGTCAIRSLTVSGNSLALTATGASPQLFIAGDLSVTAPVTTGLSAPVRFLASVPGPHTLSTVAGARLRIDSALSCSSNDTLSLTGGGEVFLNAVTTGLSAVTLAGGTLAVPVGLPALNVTLAGGTLAGDGTVGAVTGAAGGGGLLPADVFGDTLEPVGTLSCGPLALSSSQAASFSIRNAPLGVGVLGFGNSRLSVNGPVALGGAALTVSVLPDDSPRPGEFVTLIDNDGTDPVSGTFAGLPEGEVLTSGRYSFTITYAGGSGNDVAVRIGYAPSGVTRIWDGEGANNLWSNPQNWDSNTAPAPGDSVDFPADALRLAGQNDLNMGFVFHRVRFFGGNSNHGGNPLVSTGGVEFINPGPDPISWFVPSVLAGAPLALRMEGPGAASVNVSTRGLPLECSVGSGGTLSLTRGDGTAQSSPVVKKGPGSLLLNDGFSPIHTGTVTIEEGTVIPSNTFITPWIVGGAGFAATLRVDQNSSQGAVTVKSGGQLLLANIQCSVAGLTLDSGSVNSLFGGAGPLLRVSGDLSVLSGACTIAPPLEAASAFGTERLLHVAAGASLHAAQALNTDTTGSFFRKTGAGSFTLAFASPALTRFEISEGAAFFNAPASSALIRLHGGTLGGTGAVGNVTTVTAGTVAPGASPGLLGTRNLTWNAATAFAAEIEGSSPGTGHDQLAVTGTVSLGGAVLTPQFPGAFLPPAGQALVLIANDAADPVTGTFAGLPEGAIFVSSGQVLRVSYAGGDGNDVTLTRLDPFANPAAAFNTIVINPGTGQPEVSYRFETGIPGLPCSFQSSSDLVLWTTIATASAGASGTVQFQGPLDQPRLYFRIIATP